MPSTRAALEATIRALRNEIQMLKKENEGLRVHNIALTKEIKEFTKVNNFRIRKVKQEEEVDG